MSPKPAPAGGAAVDALLEPAFLENATTQPMTEVRRLRREAEQQEVNLSYTRRLLQGRLDIVRRELQRRVRARRPLAGRPAAGDPLGEGPRARARPGPAPDGAAARARGVRVLGQLADRRASTSPTISDLTDAKLEKAARALAEAESDLSERRRGVQQVMDGLAAELGRRYRDGEADVAALLADEGRH